MVEIKDMIQTMLAANNNSDTGRSGGGNYNRNRNRDTLVAQGADDDGTPITYCWSHGITRNLKHNSKDCKRKKEGHKDAATLTNKMGGCTERCKPATRNNNRDRNN